MFALIQKSLERARQHQLLDTLLDREQARGPRRRSARLHPPQRRKILFESLEPRLLLSADLLPGATAVTTAVAQDPVPPQATLHLSTPTASTSPQIHWTAPLATGDTPLYASSMVGDFDLDNFSSPLAPVAPAGSLVYAGGVQGTLDVNGDSDSLSITLDGNQNFSLRLKPSEGVQALMEVYDPDGFSLGFVAADNAGDTLILQMRSAAAAGTYSITVLSLAGAGNYTVEIFLNTALEDPDSTDASTAQDLDPAFSALLDSPGERASVIGNLAGMLPTRTLAQEDFEDFESFETAQLDGIWELTSTNSDASNGQVTESGEGGSSTHLRMTADLNPHIVMVQVDDGEGGSFQEEQYVHESSLTTATWRVNLAGVTAAVLDFDYGGYDDYGDYANQSTFIGTENFDGVALSIGGDEWVVLESYGYTSGWSHSTIDLVQVAADHGLTLGADTRIRFQMFDPGSSQTWFRDDYYRDFDNIRITTDQQEVLLTPSAVVASGQEIFNFYNPLELLTDGNVPARESFFANDTTIYWYGQEAGPVEVVATDLSPAADELSGLVFGLELAGVQRVTGLLLSLDNNDDYSVDYSLDGLSWNRLVDIAASHGESSFGMDTFRLSAPSPDNAGEPSFSPVLARYLRVYATAGDGTYAIGEIQAFTDGSSDEADYYSLTLAEGELVSFTLSLEHPGDDSGVYLQLLDADGNLLTESLPGQGSVAGRIENFLTPAAGSYTVRVAGNTTGDYHLAAVKNAQFGPARFGTQDLTLTPTVLDALSVGGSTIRVGVLGGTSMLGQLNDDTHYDFSASYVEYYQIDTAEELASFDVIVMGDYVDPFYLGSIASTLRAWVEEGHGVVTTGWMNYYTSLYYFGTVNADLDAVIPLNLDNYAGYQYGQPTVTILDASHPVTQGITDFTGNYSAYYIYGQNGIDADAQLLGSAFGFPAIVTGTPQFGRTVALSPDYNDSGAFNTGLADQLLEQAVAWAAKPANLYTVQAQAGTALSVALDLLDSGLGEPVNDLTPVLEIYDASGSMLLASGTTLASIDVLEDATYTIRVSGIGTGDYLLRASGNLPSDATPVEVISTSLDEISLVPEFPNQIDITFSEPVLYTSLDAEDLQVNGVAASSFSILSPTQVRFELADPLAGDGVYTLELSEGSVTDIHGNTNAAWSHVFTIDTEAPTVVAASVAEGASLPPGVHTLSLLLSEALDDTYLDSSDLWLREVVTDQYFDFSFDNFAYDSSTLTVSVTTPGLAEGLYELTLSSGFYAFKDQVGNPLDGDGDGTGGDPYTLQFTVDRDAASSPALNAVAPLGGLVYRAEVTDHAVHAVGDVDAFTFTLAAGQTLSLMAGQTAGSARLALELFDAETGGNSLGLAEASEMGETLLLQTLAISGGTYRVEVRSLEGAARYTLNTVLNAALEAELVPGNSNDTLATAQDIANSLLVTGSDRAAVLGLNSTGGQDWYTLHLDADQIASFVLTPSGSLGSSDLGLELYDAAGVLLTAGGDTAANVDESIIDFRALEGGDYFLRVTGNSAGWYNLVATRDQSFSLDLRDGLQDISATGEVLGALGSGGGGNGLIAVVAAPANNTGLQSIVAQLNDHSFANNNAIFVSPTDVDTLAELSQYSAVLIGGTGNYSNQFSGFAANLRAYVEGGGGLIVTGWGIYASGGLSGQTDADFNAIMPVNTAGYDYFNAPTVLPIGGHPITDGVTSFGGFDYAEYPGSSPQVKAGATVLATVGATPVAAAMEVGKGRSVYLGPIYAGYSGYATGTLRTGEADQLLEQAAAWVAGDTEDLYGIAVLEGDTLTVRTTTPLDGAGSPGNVLDVAIELLDATGAVVATASGGAADGRNVELVHVATGSGTYTVRVTSENASPQGAYVLSVTGATGADSQTPVVIQSNPVDGKRLSGAPTTLSFDLSHTVLASSLSVDDLTIDGGATVTGVEMVDGDTVRFTLVMPDTEGTYQYSLLAGALTGLQGGLSLAHAGSFTVDKSAPRVVSQNPEVQSISPFNTWSVTFDEAIDPASVQTSDFVLRNPGNNTIGINSAIVSSDGLTVTLSFSNQFTEGNYQLTVGPNIQDLAGNLMDQDDATDGNQNYLGTVQVASPDLSPIEIQVTLPDGNPVPVEGVALGSQVRVNWTVRNIGTDSARSSNWYDRLYISTDTDPSGDVTLGNFLVTNSSGLNAGGQYAMSALVTVPLNDSMAAGLYHLRVQADIYGNQPENAENNNNLYSAAFATVVPPLPDLTVSNVVAPEVIEAGKSITVSWTVNNQGGATAQGANGYWYDRVLLSTDAVFGNGDDVSLGENYYFASLPAGESQDRSLSVTVPTNRTGAWYVLVRTDIYNYVYERDNENNNAGATSAAVQVIIPTEDLTPISLTAPDTAVFGNTIEASWTVRNAGTGPTYGNWYDRLYLSTDAVLGSGDIALNYVYASESPNVRPVGAGQEYTRTIQNVQLPLNVSLSDGNYFLLLKTDDGNQEPELNEGNNVIARAISLSVPDYPDLTVSDVEVPAEVQSGAAFDVRFTLNNAGDADAINFQNAIYLSSDGTSLDFLVGTYFVNQSLAAGTSITIDKSITVPLYNPGTWQVIVVADSSNNIYEHASEGNNRGVTAAPVLATLPPLPDLVVSNIVAPVQGLAGDTITFSWTITNQGQADFSGTWNDRVYLTDDTGSTTQNFGTFSFEGSLAVGASITRTQNLTLLATQEGTRRFVVQTDANEQVNETPTGQFNNTALDDTQLSITFPPLPNLQVTGITPPDEPFSGTQTTISWVVTNNGTGATSAGSWSDQIMLSLDDQWDTTEDNIYLATVTNPNYLPVGESYQNSATISIPRGLNGNYYFLVRTDVYGSVFEDTFENDNTRVTDPQLVQLTPPPDLRVDLVEAPNEEFSGTPITISWTVGNHGEGPTAEAGWYDRVIMSENDILGDADDRRMGDVWHNGRLGKADPEATDDTYTVSHTFDLPIGVIGDFHFFVITDVNNHVYEHGSDANNSALDMKSDGTGPELTRILLTPPPDLEVYSITAPAMVEAGHTYNASWRVVNFGSTPTPNSSWTDRLYLSTDGVLDAGDIFLRDLRHSGALGVVDYNDAGDFITGFYDATASFTLPFDISGEYRLIVKTDIHNQVFEGFDNPDGADGEDNNQAASSTMAVDNRPADLVVENLVVPATGEAGKQVSLTWTVRNTGTGDSVANNWLDQIRLSVDDILFDDDDVLLRSVFHSGVLNAGGSYTHTETVTLPFSLTGGSYRMYVLGDSNARVTESDESNNTAFATIQVLRETPDLQVTDVAHEASGMVGLPLDVSWRVENLGANQTDAGNWYDEVFLSLDAVLDSSDTSLGLRYRNAALAAGAGYDASASFTLPASLAPNDYFVIVRTDRNNAVTEGTAGESNNTRVSEATVPVVAFDPNNPEGVLPTALLRPDLRVTAVDAPVDAISGQLMSVSWTVTNDAADPTGNRSWYDAIYLSRDGVLDRNADLYLGYAYQSNLAAGASYTQVLDVRVPYGQSGPFYLFVATDAGRAITESNELNNTGQEAAFTQVALAPPADLVVGDIDIPVNGVPGQLATIQFSVLNQGSNPALGSWSDSVYLSTDDTWDIDDALFGVVTHHGDVAGGMSYSSSLTATLPGLTPGSYKVIVRSDIRNRIPESDETNNIQGTLDSVALDVEALSFDSLGVATDSGTLGSGQAVYYKFEVAAGETVRLSFDGAGDGIHANELYVRQGSMPTRGQYDIAAREGFVTDPSLTIPTTQAGTYYVLAYGQSVSGSPAYAIKAEIIPFSITEVNATEVGNTGNVTLRIEGAKFGDNTEFSLVAADGTVITAHEVYLDNSSEAYATFSLFGAAIGSYDVRAEQVLVQGDGTRLVQDTTTRVDAITVSEGLEAAVYMTIAGPTDVMVNRTAIFTLNYVNEGGADSDVPLMVVESFSATPMGLSASDLHTTPLYIMAASFDGPMDTLRPGARYSVPIVFKTGSQDGNLDIRVGRILTTDTRLITDWSAIEAGARPSDADDAEWSSFWDRVQPLIGLTWGEYVQVLDRMMLLVSEPGNPVRDVREIFSRMMQLNPDYIPYNSLSGEVRDSETDLGLADVQMAAYLLRADGSLEYKASALSDADGRFNFARLEPGQYSVVAIGQALDMDRDGQLDLTVPSVTLGHASPGDAGVIYIQPPAGSGTSTDSNPALNRDANGVTHMVWTREGMVWHAWFDTASGTWKDAQALSTEDGYGPVITSSDKLFDGTTAGTIVAWQQGKGNDANIWYAVARAQSGGGFEWSAPRQLTDIDPARDPADDVLDGAVQIIVSDTGTVMFTFIKRDTGVNGDGTGVQDDSDLYFEIWAFGEDEFTWPAPAEVLVADDAASDPALDPEGVSAAFGRQWKFGPWNVLGGAAELVLALNGTISENNCKVTLGAQGQIQGSVKGSNIRSTVSGNGAVTAEWGVNQAAKDWMFNSAKASVGASVQFDWRYGLSTLLSKIPHPAVTAAHLAYSLAVGLGSRLGLEFEDGITFGGGINISVMEWKLTQPFPDFVRPDGIFEADLSGTFGLYAQLDVGPTGDSFRVQGDITVTLGIEPVFKVKSVTGNITFSGNIGWMPFNEVFSVTLYNNESAEVIASDAQTQDVYIPIFDADALIGTGLAYGDNHVLDDVSQDVTSDSAMTLAKDDGVIFGAWTHMAETRPDEAGWLGQIGWQVMVAEYGAGWGTPVALPDSLGVNAEATAAVDGNGQRMVLWTHAASPLSATPTLEDLEAAMDANNLVYALYDEGTGTWGAMQTLATTAGMDNGITTSHNAAGQLVVSWVFQGADELDRLMTATWNGSAWSTASEVAVGGSIMDPAMERLGDDLIVVWEVDANPDPEETEKSLYYSIFDGASWSAGAMFDPIAMATGMALSAGLPQATTADEDLSLMSGFPPFPVPEECLKCKPEEIKRIRESAPNCIDGGGTEVTFDEKTCTEKTIVYRPCVVRPRDPNDIIGPEGYGEEGWISSKGVLEYMIRFENAADASAPAQQVVITQQLDDDLDWRTFRIDDFGFGDQIIALDGKSAFYQTRLDYTADPTRGYFLDVSASVDVTTGIITWTMTTIDPATGDLPQEASVGFLPVNDTVYDPDDHDVVLVQGTGRGEGYVTYTVRAKAASPTGTVVDAQARIIFDTEEPIDTPAIANTLDAGVPTSQVITFANTTTPEGEFLVQWGGADDEAGSGLRDYSIYVSIDGGDFEIWLPDTELTEAIYLGSEGHTYSFFSTVRDWAGNEETESGVSDAAITVAGATGIISGTKFEDYDGDGVRDAGETGLDGWTIYLDADNNSVFDTGEISTVTGLDGSYSFLDLNPGAYTVREVALDGWVQTAPGASGHAATVVSGETTDGLDFGNFALAQIGGQLFSDSNANGALDDGEEGLAGWTLTLDKDGNGSIDATTTTDEYGFYRFTGVGPGSYTVMQVPQAGWLQTGPASGEYTVLTTSGADIGGADFANVAAAGISGTKFEDVNGNGERDVDERGLSGWTIFLDANANGSLDGSERFVVTGSDGAYSFTDLLPGNYVIAEVMQDGWVQTSPGAGPSSAAAGVTLSLSGMDVVLSLPEDVVAEGDLSVQATSANALADTLVGLDAFRTDPRFAGITGTRVTTVVIDTGIDLDHSWFGPDADNNGIADRIVYSWDFADQDANAGDLNGHGSHIASLIGGQDATYGGVAQDADLIALKVFGDDGSGYFSYLEAALQWVVLNASAYDVGVINLSLGDGENWDTAIGRYGLGDELAALAGMNILITAASGNNYFQYSGELGVAYPAADPAVLAVGAVWSGSFGGPVNYANGAADYSTGADRLAAFGQRDDALLDILAPGTRMVGANYNGGTRTMFGTSQASAYMAGIATLAQDLALDHLGRKLSMAEFSSLLASTSVLVRDGDDEHDNVENTGLDFARIDLLSLAEGILALTPDGPGDSTDGGDTSTGGETQPLAAPGVHQFSLAAGEQHTGTDFGNFLLGSIGGTVFDDRNADASRQGAEAGLGGWTVFLDGDANGQFDIGEHSTETLSDGSYRFNGIGPGSYHVSLIGQDGWSRTTAAAIDVPMTSGLQADADFGVNALPALAAIDDMLVDEGSVLAFSASGTDDAADSLAYSLAGDSHGATIDAATGAFQWTAPDGNASTGFTVRVTDGAGGMAERSFTVTVANVAPSLTLSGAASVTDDQDFLLDLASSDPGQDTLTGWTIQWGDGSSSQLDAAAGNLAHRYAAPGDYTVLATATDEDGSYSTSTTVTVLPGTLKVSALTATATGFQVRFNRGFVPDEINLYDSSFYNRGAADIALRDAAGRLVAGSVVLDDDHQGLSFVRTGGLLANGNYTVTLDSRADAFATAQGGLLDGNRDGTAGDHFSGSFSIGGSGAVLRIGEFARGPGQAADVPATAAGVPITIAGAAGAQQVSFTLAYDPALLAITGVSGGAGMPVGSTVSADFSTPGQVRIALSLGSALGAGSLELVRLSAHVPGSAPYGAKQVLDLRDIALDTGAAVRDDDGLHLVAYVGDASGNAKYSTLDVQRIQRTVLRMDSGFGAYPLIDPVVVADINGNGALSSLDAQRVLSEVMGLDRAEIPAIPQGMTLTFSGPDPVVSAASVAATPGDTVVVPITLDTAAGLESVEITLEYPADSLELLDVRLGGLTQDFQYFVKDTSVPGRIVIDMARMSAMAGGAGTLVELEFRVADDAQGSLAIDLQATALNETRLTLFAESQPGQDPTDGRILLPVAQAPVVVVTTTDALVPEAVAPAAAPATVLPSFEIASPVVQPLPQINFSQPVPVFDTGARPSTGWVGDWVAGNRDTSTNPLKLNNWKLGAPVTRITSR